MLSLIQSFVEECLGILFIVLLNFVSYEGALRAGLVFDDHLAIENNPVCNSSAVPITTYVYPDAEYQENYHPKKASEESVDLKSKEYPVESPHSWKAAWFTDFWGNSLQGDHTHLSYRPITTLTFRLDHWMTNHFSKSKAKRKRKIVVPKFKNGKSEGVPSDPDLNFQHTYEELHDYHDPYRLHLVNIVLHILNTLFFYNYLCRVYLKTSRFASIIGAALFAVHPVHVESVTGIVGRAELLCLFFGFVAFHAYFKYHPVAQTVGQLSVNEHTSPNIMTGHKASHKFSSLFRTLKFFFFNVLFVLAIVLSSLSKETGITIAAICLAYDFILMWRHHALLKEEKTMKHSRKLRTSGPWASIVSNLPAFSGFPTEFLSNADISVSSYPFIVFRIVALITIYGFLHGRQVLLSGRIDLGDSGLIRKVENPFYSLPKGLWRKISFTYLHAKNLQLLLWPYELCCEYGFDCIPAFTSFSDPRMLGIVATFALLAYIGLHCFYIPGIGSIYSIVKSTLYMGIHLVVGSRPDVAIFRKKFSVFDIVPEPRLCMSSFWLIAPYLPVSHLLVSVGTNIAERCLYIPSVGICLLATCLIFEIEKALLRKGSTKGKRSSESPKESTISQSPSAHFRRKNTLYFCTQFFLLCVVALGIQKTRERTRDWYSDKSLFESAVRVCPRSAKNNNQLGLSRWNEGRIIDGKELFETAARLFPEWSEPHFNLARYHYMTQDVRRAFLHLEQCVNGLFPKEGCIQMYFSTFSALFPNPNATQVIHTAQILEKLQQYGQAASQYRQAGLRFLQGENSWKKAEYAFQSALRLHESGQITDAEIERRRAQQGEESLTMNGDLESRCNVLYWLGVTQMYQHNILGFCHHLHKLLRSCSENSIDRITALQGLPILMQQMPMLVNSPFNLNKLEKGYGRGVLVAIFGQYIDALYFFIRSIPLSTKERAEYSAKLTQAALDMSRLTFTSDELNAGLDDQTDGPVFKNPSDSLFLDEEVSHLGTERMYGVEVQRALRDALHTLTAELELDDDRIPSLKEDVLIFGSTKRERRFDESDYRRNKITNHTKYDDRWETLAKKCALYPSLIQTNWRMGDIDEGHAVVSRCLVECVGDMHLVATDTNSEFPSAEDVTKYQEAIKRSRKECMSLQALK